MMWLKIRELLSVCQESAMPSALFFYIIWLLFLKPDIPLYYFTFLICKCTVRKGKSFLELFFFPLFDLTEAVRLVTCTMTDRFSRYFFPNCPKKAPVSNIIFFLVFNMQGVLCAAPLIFIIPSACYLKLSEEPRTHSDKIMSCVMLPIGAVVMAVGFVMAVTSPQDCSHGQEMFYCSPDNFSLTNISISHFQLTTQLSILNVSIFQWVASFKKNMHFNRLLNCIITLTHVLISIL